MTNQSDSLDVPLSTQERAFLRDVLARAFPEYYDQGIKDEHNRMAYNVILKLNLPQDGWLRVREETVEVCADCGESFQTGPI